MNNFSSLSNSPNSYVSRMIAELKNIAPMENAKSKNAFFEHIKIRLEQVANEPSPAGTFEELRNERTLEGKNRVMHTMRIVTVPAAAIFLSAQPADLHRLHQETKGSFGCKYMQALCFSIDELKVIAKHPHWLWSLKHLDDMVELELPDDLTIARATWVGTDVASGYLQIGYITDLNGLGTRWGTRRPVRLSSIQAAFVGRSVAVNK